MDAEALAGQKQRGGGLRVDARCSVPAGEFRSEVGDAGIEQLKATGRVLQRHLGGERLEGQLPLKLVGPPEQLGQHAVGIAVAAGLAGGGRLADGSHGPGQLDGVVQVGFGRLRMGEGEPVGMHVEGDCWNE